MSKYGPRKKKDGVYTTSQLGAKSKTSASTILRAILARKIKAYKTPGGHFRITEENAQKFLNQEHDAIDLEVFRKKIVLALRNEGMNLAARAVMRVRP